MKFVPGVDLEDQHIVHAAICARVNAITTFNLKHFPSQLERYKIEIVHPSICLIRAFEAKPKDLTGHLVAMAEDSRRTLPEILARLAWSIPEFSTRVASAEIISLPNIPPQEWRR